MKLKNKKKAFFPLIIALVVLISVSLGTHTPIGSKENQIDFYSLDSADVYATQIEIDDVTANNWTWAKIMGYCIGSGTEMDPYVIGNDTFSYASGDALVIKNSRKYFTVINCTFENSNSVGLLLNNISNGLVKNNTFYNNLQGMSIYDSWDVNVTECVFDSNTQYNLFLDHSDNNTILLNTITGKNDQDYGIGLSYSHDNLLINNTFSTTHFALINVAYSNNNDIIGNNFFRGGHAVLLYVGHYNVISQNEMFRCNWGISLANSDYNLLSDNFVKDSIISGFDAHDSEYNTFANNIFNNVSGCYIGPDSKFNQVVNNNISNNPYLGISVGSSDDNIVRNNYLNNNTIGIRVSSNSDRNNFSGNVIKNSIEKEFLIYGNSHFNYVFNNTFVGNGLPAEDNSSNNFWDNGAIGNSWDNYVGTDSDDNGIGDSPYSITGTAGSQDRYPIYSDGDDIGPQIIINSPSGGAKYGEDAPIFNLTIYDPNLESFWYTIDGLPTKNFETISNGVNLITIGDLIWNALSDGNHVFRFVANDTIGHETYIEITINKDTSVDSEPGIPGFNLVILIGSVLSSIGFSARKIKKKKHF